MAVKQWGLSPANHQGSGIRCKWSTLSGHYFSWGNTGLLVPVAQLTDVMVGHIPHRTILAILTAPREAVLGKFTVWWASLNWQPRPESPENPVSENKMEKDWETELMALTSGCVWTRTNTHVHTHTHSQQNTLYNVMWMLSSIINL